MNNPSQITVRRTTYYVDRLRGYEILLDGVPVETVRAGQAVTIPVNPGTHFLLLRIDWCSNAVTSFEICAGEHLAFECGSNLAGWRLCLALFFILFRTRDYLFLRRSE